jgi:TolB protein
MYKYRVYLFSCIVVAATSCLFASESEKKAADGNDSQVIMYTSRRDGVVQIVLVKDDGTEVKRLTHNKAHNTYPAWSPDGTRIVFTSRDSMGSGLFLIDADGENLQHFTHGNDNSATWSPDGKYIVYSRFVARGKTKLLKIGLNDSSEADAGADAQATTTTVHVVKELTDGSHWDADPAWSPDGKRIAFASDRSGSWRLYVMDADGRNAFDRSQTDNSGGNVYPAWSPDGRQIAYTESVRDGTRQIFVIDSIGRNKKQLTKEGDFNCYAAWSPDGKKIAYMSFETRQSKGNLSVMNPDGSDQKVIVRDAGAGHNGRPAWKPK